MNNSAFNVSCVIWEYLNINHVISNDSIINYKTVFDVSVIDQIQPCS